MTDGKRHTAPADWKRALFAPRAVALIGASDDPQKPAARPLQFLKKHGFNNPVYPINPKRRHVLGVKSYPSLDALPGPVDHAYILLNAEAAIDAVAACGRAGVRVATLLADGFAEAGNAGVQRQRRLVSTAAGYSVRLIGPNSLGVIDLHRRLTLSANAALAVESLTIGKTAVLSQSGSILGALISRGAARGLGFSKLISVGNEADLGIGELGSALVDDADTEAILLFLETIRQPDLVADFAAAAHRAGKPVIAYKLGRSSVGRSLAVSHTGALVGPEEAVDAFLAARGIVRVDQFDALFEMPPMLTARQPATKPRKGVAVITTTGGGGAMIVDQLGVRGITVAGPGARARKRLHAANINVGNSVLIDLTLAGTRPDRMAAAIDALLVDKTIDGIVVVVGSSAQFQPKLAVQPIIERAAAEKPIAVFLLPQADAALRSLSEAGVAAFRTPEACADAVAAWYSWVRPRPPTPLPAQPRKAMALLRRLDPGHVGEAAALDIFAALGIETIPYRVVCLDALDRLGADLAYPVVVKAHAADLAHKSAAGGVILDVRNKTALKSAARRVVTAVERRRIRPAHDQVLVQPQAAGVAELIVGFRRDPQVGPIVVVGLGGTHAEVFNDIAVRPAPTDRRNALEMLASLRAAALLDGSINGAASDLSAVADCVSRLSRLAQVAKPEIEEAEINPLIVRRKGDGAVAVDGLLRLAV